MLITVVIPVSPIPAHPDADILTATIDSVRHHLPGVDILLTFDGVRAEQQHLREQYTEHIARVHRMSDTGKFGRPVRILEFDTHQHQVGMMRHAIDQIDTPLLMYVEHDMPLRVGRRIDFPGIAEFILSGRSDLVRLYLRETMPDAHAYLMHGRDEIDARFLRTTQWSQNVHVASTELYRRILTEHFSPDANCFIEDRMWGAASETCPEKFRLHIYWPEDDIKYLLHLDGRRTESKFEAQQVY